MWPAPGATPLMVRTVGMATRAAVEVALFTLTFCLMFVSQATAQRATALPDTAAARFHEERAQQAAANGDTLRALAEVDTVIQLGAGLDSARKATLVSPMVSAYLLKANIYAARGQRDSAGAVLRRGVTDLHGLPYTLGLVQHASVYAMDGKPAADIVAEHWLNVPEGTTHLAMHGQVTVLEFSAHWCGPCTESYPTFVQLYNRFAPLGVHFGLVTELYGRYGGKEATPTEELAADRHHFIELHKLPFPIAIADARATDESETTDQPARVNPNVAHYGVQGLPTVVVVDSGGIIRYASIGWTSADSLHLTRAIEQLVLAPAVSRLRMAPSPDSCRREIEAWRMAQFQHGRDAGVLVDYATIETLSRRLVTQGCTDRFSIASTPFDQLQALAELHGMAGRDSLARAAIDRRVSDPTLTPAARVRALLDGIGIFVLGTGRDPGRHAIIRAYADRVDQLGAAFPRERFQARLWAFNTLLSDTTDMSNDRRIVPAAESLFAIVRQMTPADKKAVGVSLVRPYETLIMLYANQGQARDALRVMTLAEHDVAGDTAAVAALAPIRTRLSMIGTTGSEVSAAYWLNGEGEMAGRLQGRVSVIEFSAHWCGPCRASYPAMAELYRALAPRGVHMVLATQTYGWFGAKQHISAAEEVLADSGYFVGTHGLHFPIAIEVNAASHAALADDADDTSDVASAKIGGTAATVANVPTAATPSNFARYHVAGVPTFVVVDQRGVIRLVILGWRPMYQDTIRRTVEQLLAEAS
jgi:thiol-disulfide isomerase/thioredoxin